MVGAPFTNSASIYGTTFDYRKAEPAISQFPGKTSQQIAEHCKSENLGTMELTTCAQFKFESAKTTLAKTVEAAEKEIEKNDGELRKNHNPIACRISNRHKTIGKATETISATRTCTKSDKHLYVSLISGRAWKALRKRGSMS
jgi:hypothetical protein